MKKLILLIAMIALLSCEKERCFTCTVKVEGIETLREVICGDMTRADAKELTSSMTTSVYGIRITVDCKED